MNLLSLEISGFKSFAKKTVLSFESQVTAIVGPNGSGKSNVAEAFRWVLGEQSLKSLRGKRGEDLIFNGGNSTGSLSKAQVTVTFNNEDKKLPVDFDAVSISRSVYRDGTNEYKINNSIVRLKDIIELLASVSLGASGHHIISQGEADRILNASLKDRREIIEEALGLKVYQWKISDSEKKLAKTIDNIREVELLRREIAPHLKFLKKQVEKIEKIDELRRNLKTLYLEYFRREDYYLANQRQVLAELRSAPSEKLVAVNNKLSQVESLLSAPDEEIKTKLELESSLDYKLRQIERDLSEVTRSLGRLEGMIEIKKETVIDTVGSSVPFTELETFVDDLSKQIDTTRQMTDLSTLQQFISNLREEFKRFLKRYQTDRPISTGTSLEALIAEKNTLASQREALLTEEQTIRAEKKLAGDALDQAKKKMHGAEKELYELRAERSGLLSELQDISARENLLQREEDDFRRELAEAVVLVDTEVEDFKRLVAGLDFSEPRDNQEQRRRELEKIKIRLEDMGVEGTDVLEEYKETVDRDAFLEKELIDLKDSSSSLEQMMTELKDKLTIEFKDGITKINTEFANYFALMFGGGKAELVVVAPAKNKQTDDLSEMLEKAPEEGIDITVSLPRKKIKGLVMMSGGERALTSIALLFALSQVNPPPFLILDETDAALDEANSKKYGDMVEKLSERSQLIVITHNRETMSRAGILYGITMGADSVSKLLSIKFDQAEGFAK